MQTITSNSWVLYNLVKWYLQNECILQKTSAQIVEINGNKYITEDKNLMKYSLSTSWECNYSFDSSLPSNPPIAVCSKCGFQKRESTVSEKQDFWWIYDCAKAIKEYREEEWGRWTTEGIEEIISRHYKHI